MDAQQERDRKFAEEQAQWWAREAEDVREFLHLCTDSTQRRDIIRICQDKAAKFAAIAQQS